MTSLNDRLKESPERSPEEAVLIMRLSVFVNMRWFAILGVILATLALILFGLLDIPRIETGQIVQEMKEVSLR